MNVTWEYSGIISMREFLTSPMAIAFLIAVIAFTILTIYYRNNRR